MNVETCSKEYQGTVDAVLKLKSTVAEKSSAGLRKGNNSSGYGPLLASTGTFRMDRMMRFLHQMQRHLRPLASTTGWNGAK